MLQNTEPTVSTTSKFSSKIFESFINSYKEQLLEVKNDEGIKNLILTDFRRVCQQFILMATSTITDPSEKITAEEESFTYLIQYLLPEAMKDLLILHRDVLLQLNIGKHKNLERLASDDAMIALFEDSKKVLVNALDFFLKKLVLEENKLKGLSIKTNGIKSRVRHHTSPWPVYEVQFNTLLAQLTKIDERSTLIQRFIAVFRELKTHTKLVVDKTMKESVSLTQTVSEVKIKVTESVEKSDLISWLDTILPSGQNNTKIQQEYTDSVENKIKNLVPIDVPVGTNDGLLLEKWIDFNKTVKKWLDYNLLPLLMDLWEIQSNMDSYAKHAYLNLKTGLNLSKTTDTILTSETQLQTLETIQTTLTQNLKKQESIVSEINEMLSNQLAVTNIYNPKEFLEVSLQSSISQYTSDTNTLLVNLQDTAKSLLSKFGASYDKAISEEPKSKLEDATICIAHRMLKEANTNYDSLFLNKNFIGDFFLIPRTSQEQKIADSIAHWENGFSKSILVLGRSLCGKSTFLEQTGKKHFSRRTIYLNPDSNAVVEGRKFKTTKDLKEALQEIKRIGPSTKPVLIIDDLELWRDSNHSLLNNMRAMLDFIESESDHILVIAAVSNSLCAHLDRRIDFSKTFSTVLQLDYSETEEIYNAILIRNGATHKTLVDPEGEPISKKQIASLATKLSKMFNYNIGEVLQAWTYGTTVMEDNKVLYEDKINRFPDFFSQEEIIILKHTSLYGSINEKSLKEYTGNQYELTFKSGLKRLVNTKVLLREEHGSLKINPVLGHDVYEILKYRDILN